jgi:hypothetical protein
VTVEFAQDTKAFRTDAANLYSGSLIEPKKPWYPFETPWWLINYFLQ